jgi:hypothetical protein
MVRSTTAIPKIPSPPRRRGPRFGKHKRGMGIDAIMQINPVWIHRLYDSKFPGAIPFLQLLLSLDCIRHEVMMFMPNKHFQRIRFGKAVKYPVLMIPNAIPKRAGDADIHRAAVTVGHDVDRRTLLFAHPAKSTRKRIIVNASGAPAFAGVTGLYLRERVSP